MAKSTSPGDSSRLVRCEAHNLSYDAQTSSGCTLCRRSAQPAPSTGTSVVLKAALALTLIAAALYVARDAFPFGSTPSAIGQLTTTNAAGRSGSYYIPASAARPMPMLVVLHGTGGNGHSMVQTFQALADERGFAIVAPDSRRDPNGQFNWQVGDQPGDVTPDLTHVLACLNELRAAHGEQSLSRDVLIAGHSGGASSAPYIATNTDAFTAYAVLHGGVFAQGLGRRAVRGWFSTGDRDALRTPEHVREAANTVKARGLPAPEYRELSGGHEISEAESRALIAWWLDGR